MYNKNVYAFLLTTILLNVIKDVILLNVIKDVIVQYQI